MYQSQTANVRWGTKVSNFFKITNGVKQGAVLSATLFCIYIDELIKRLRRNRTGCWIDGNYVGIIVYADDIVLLSPTLDGLQEMIDTCSNYAINHNLSFSTHENVKKSKTKCLAFLKTKRTISRSMILDSKTLPWVNSIKHLGVTITNKLNGMRQDVIEKRAQYVAKNNELMQEFHYADPTTIAKLNNIYNTHFYGAPVWDLFSLHVQRLEKAWNISNRIMFSLPRTTHRYLIEPISCREHIIFSIWRRFLKFTKCLAHNRKSVLRNIFEIVKRDCQSITGRNLRNIMLKTDLDVYSNEKLKPGFKINAPYQPIPDSETWRIQVVKEILDVELGATTIENFSKEELDIIKEFACCT